MKKHYIVTFQYSETTYCSNIAIALCEEDVKSHYSKYEWFSIQEATESDIKEAERKNKPFVECEHIQQEEKELYTACEESEKNCNKCHKKNLCDKYCSMELKNFIYSGNNGSYIINEKDLNCISGIESLNYEECEKLMHWLLGSEKIIINEHEVFLLDLHGYFGYSALVFKNKKHLYYADDFQLHHKYYYPTENYDEKIEHTPETLKPLYIEYLSNKIFSENQLFSALDYNEYQKKDYYLHNYWIQQFDYKSAFVISGSKEEKELEKAMKKYNLYNRFSFCYMNECDNETIEKQGKMIEALKNSYKSILDDNEKFRKAIRFELDNHEACISMEYCEALSALGLSFKKLDPEKQRIVMQELDACISAYC